MDATMQIRTRREGGRDLPLLLWRFPSPVRMIASAPHGGGLGLRRWLINAQVPTSYARKDPEHHLAKLGVSLGLAGRGVGMLTAVGVRDYGEATDHGASAVATVGLGHPTLAAADDDTQVRIAVGTINIVVLVPEPLSDGALVNAVATATEAKVQALIELGIEATGTATDAVCLACPDASEGHVGDAFGGPRSLWGSRLARAVRAAVLAGAVKDPPARRPSPGQSSAAAFLPARCRSAGDSRDAGESGAAGGSGDPADGGAGESGAAGESGDAGGNSDARDSGSAGHSGSAGVGPADR